MLSVAAATCCARPSCLLCLQPPLRVLPAAPVLHAPRPCRTCLSLLAPPRLAREAGVMATCVSTKATCLRGWGVVLWGGRGLECFLSARVVLCLSLLGPWVRQQARVCSHICLSRLPLATMQAAYSSEQTDMLERFYFEGTLDSNQVAFVLASPSPLSLYSALHHAWIRSRPEQAKQASKLASRDQAATCHREREQGRLRDSN